VTAAILDAAQQQLVERGFARMSIASVAAAAGVHKPAVYRRFPSKAELVVAAIATNLPDMTPPPPGPARIRCRAMMDRGFPPDAVVYVGLIGGLMAEYRYHPELIETFRERLLLPRRALVRALIEEGQANGEIRAEIDPELAIDLLAGPLLARTFAGLDVGAGWRDEAFELWWEAVRAR
jgi:AcrR family transcriptional regulator